MMTQEVIWLGPAQRFSSTEWYDTTPENGLHLFNHENVNVPEPSVLLLMTTGLVGIGFSRLKEYQST
ncbi:MAG: PEP-CTERM sorting domain-containing protein [Candidatus Thiodiazotropha sp. (ex Lucinoma borealis)]|nr:PEP-CTERM sorting domain-containing protein [Candidatus Thiodiazotropha sp. (ex Lucinoma borealis)]